MASRRLLHGSDDPYLQGRFLHFVRHGQYHSGEGGSGALTALGKKQAERLARHFEQVGVDAISSSDMLRAVQTADILERSLGIRGRRHRMLREMLPTRISGMRIPLEKRIEGARRLESIIRKFFKPSRQTRHEVIICHGNLIRSLVLRASVGRAEGWHMFWAHHASITTFLVSRRGVNVMAVNALEHVPERLRSYF